MTDVLSNGDGRLYVRLRRGVYVEVNSRGERKGVTVGGFEPRPRWKEARHCDPELGTLTCRHCHRYDLRYAQTGKRSYCRAT